MHKEKIYNCGSCNKELSSNRFKKCPECGVPFTARSLYSISTREKISVDTYMYEDQQLEIKKVKVKPGDNKDRIGKLRPSLILPEFLLGVITVLTYGAKKYSAYSWQKVDNPIESYTDALERHLLKIKMGEQIDEEWGLHHMFHLATNAMFLWWHLKNKAKFDNKNS